MFNTHQTSGGMVNCVNGSFAMGDYIDGDQILIDYANIYVSNIVATDEVLEFLRGMYPPGPPPNEPTISTTKNTISKISPGLPQIAINGVTVSGDPSAGAADSLIKIRVILNIIDALMDTPSLCHSVTLPDTLASLRRMLQMTELAVRVYQNTPLAKALSLAIMTEAKHCQQLLKELLIKMSNYRHVFSAAMLHFIRQKIWSRTGECSDSASLNSKLRQCHDSFAACILALGRRVRQLTGIYE